MDYPADYDNPLISIPQKKIDNAIQEIIDSFPGYKGHSVEDRLPKSCRILVTAINRYAKANIPVDYWDLHMQDFKGDKNLLKIYEEIIKDIYVSYNNGIKICLAGNYGTGKTMTCACVLKKAVETGYSGLYVTLTDVVTLMGSRDANAKYLAKQHLLNTDFLVIDEFDPRFMGSDNASDFYGRVLETTLRARIHNRMPILLCTNSPNVLSSFSGSLKQSISSLMNLVKIVPVLGSDHRKENHG